MAHTITINETANAIGTHLTKYGAMWNQTLKQDLEWEKILPFVSCDHSYQGKDAEVAEILQPYHPNWTPKHTETFGGELNTLGIGKIDLQFDWATMETFFNKYMNNWFEAGKPENTHSYPAFVINNLIAPKVLQEMNDIAWNGQYVTPDGTTPGAYLTTFDGYKKKIADWITAGKVVPIATGALAANTIVDQVRDFCKSLPATYRKRPGMILMSADWVQAYAEAYEAAFPHQKVMTDNPDMPYVRVNHYNKVLVPINSMIGSSRMICKFDGLDGLIVGTREGYNRYPQLRMYIEKRSICFAGEYYRFFGVETHKNYFVNDQI